MGTGGAATLFAPVSPGASCAPGAGPVFPHRESRMKSTHVRSSDVEERWLLYDASEQALGRMASKIAMALMGKDQPSWTPNQLTGAHVVVINAAQARVSGNKAATKTYQNFTRYPGGLNEVAMEDMRRRRPNDIVTLAVRRMLPKTRLGHRMLSRLKVYPGAEHPHAAQGPVQVDLA